MPILKDCTKYYRIKNIKCFSKNKNTKDGYMPICKDCIALYHQQNKERLNSVRKNFYKRFPWKKTLRLIRERCLNKNSKDYSKYGGRGIECRITEYELKDLWYQDMGWSLKQPSIDRIDNDGNYEYTNCQYIEKGLNSKKDKMKRILQYDLNGNFITEWESITEASKNLNISTG